MAAHLGFSLAISHLAWPYVEEISPAVFNSPSQAETNLYRPEGNSGHDDIKNHSQAIQDLYNDLIVHQQNPA